MRNLKRALSLTLASIMLLGMMVVGSSAASYQDVNDEHNVEAIEVLQAVGIMVGDEGNFNPEKNVTRNEMAVIMSNLMDYRVASYSGTSPFTDVPAWAEPYVAACYTNGITSGTSATTYNGSGNVTTAQAALMVMKALGYFQTAADFGEDWQLATTRQANRIDLLIDVKAGVKEAMTRNDVAQLVLNALESGTVEADNSNNINVSVGGEMVSIGGTKYVYVTSSEDYAFAINNARNTSNDGQYSNGSIVELGEKLYQGDLTKKDDTDAFGRPADIWEYETKEIGTYAKGADYTFTAKVTGKALYNAISSTVANYPTWNVSVDGDPVNYDGADLRGMRTDDDACFLKGVAANDDYKAGESKTGNGVLTQVYVDSTNREVNIAVIHFYAAEVLRVNKDDETITLSDLDKGPAKADDLFDTTAFEEDEIVVYSYSNKTGDIETVAAADSMEGEVSRVRINTANNGQYSDGDNFTADGTDYKYSFTMSSEDRLQTEHVNNTVVGYTDSYGYVIYIDESAMTYDYAYVLKMNKFKDQYGDDTWYARLVLTDGTLIRVETDNDKDLTGYLVSYSKDKNDVYTLAERSNYALREAKSLDINSGVASIKADTESSKFVANSNTVFIVAQSETKNNQPDYDNYDFRVYTGIANVPDIDGVAGTKAVVAARNGNVARVVYIEDGDVSGLDDVIFVRADSTAKLEKDTELGNYYIISAVVDGSVVSWKVKELSRAAEKLVTKLTGENGESNPGKVVLAASDVYEDADGLVTNVTLYKDFDGEDGVDRGTGTGKHENSTIGLGDTRYGYNGKDVVVVKYDQWDAFSVERINSIKDDYNDKWVAVFDGNVVTGVCYIENEGTGTPPAETRYNVDANTGVEFSTDRTTGWSSSLSGILNGTQIYVRAQNGYEITAINADLTHTDLTSFILTRNVVAGDITVRATSTVPGLDVEMNFAQMGIEGREWYVTAINYTGEKAPTEQNVIDEIIRQTEARGYTHVATRYFENENGLARATTYKYFSIEFTRDNGTGTYYVLWVLDGGAIGNAPVVDITKTSEVSGDTGVTDALGDENTDKVVVTGDANISDTAVSKPVEVQSGATLTLGGSAVSGEITGKGTVAVTGNVTGAENIKAEGGIELSNGGKVSLSESAGEAEVSVDVTVSGTATLDAPMASGTTVTVESGAVLNVTSSVGDLPKFEGTGTVVIGNDVTLSTAEGADYLDDLQAKINVPEQTGTQGGTEAVPTLTFNITGKDVVTFSGEGKLQSWSNDLTIAQMAQRTGGTKDSKVVLIKLVVPEGVFGEGSSAKVTYTTSNSVTALPYGGEGYGAWTGLEAGENIIIPVTVDVTSIILTAVEAEEGA